MGHSPVAALIDPVAGSRTAIAEASNIVWAPIKDGLDGISLSANWMWAVKRSEDARLYAAVELF
jgi:phosphoribosylformylglycinamidine synthase